MSKVLVIPDSHLKIDVIENGIELANHYKADKIVLLGDYFDDWYAVSRDYYDMVDYLKLLLRKDPRIVALLGNHELSYMGFPCSGHNKHVAEHVMRNIYPDHRFYWCAAFDGVLYSHAGVTTAWLRANKILTENEIRYKLSKNNGADFLEVKIGNVESLSPFAKAGPGRGGNSYPSLLWADAEELMTDSIPNIKQVVGHTPVKEIQCVGKCWFTDVYSNFNISDEYLLVVNGKPEIVHYGDMAYER